LLYFLFDTWTTIFFWYMVGLAGYWFIFYKLENRAYVLLPLGYWRPIYRNFDILFGLLASAKLIVIFLKMASQTSYDVFFIDWEKPKKDPKNPKANDNINVWRTIITANEMNELQNTPLVTIEFTYLVYIFFMISKAATNPTTLLSVSFRDKPIHSFINARSIRTGWSIPTS